MGHARNKRDQLAAVEAMLQFAPDEGYSIYDLSEQLSCDPSTVHRYLKEIEQERPLIQVRHGRYRLDPSQTLSSVRLHPAEALSIYLALRRFIRQTSHAPLFMLTALKKVAPAVLQPRLIQTLSASILQLENEQAHVADHTEIWRTIIRGWLDEIVVRIEYQRANDGSLSTHEIEPLHFEPATLSHGTYLIAWSLTRGTLRTFKIDRIQRANLTTQRFNKRADLDANALLRHAWGIWYGENTEHVELRFSPRVGHRVLETIWHPGEQKQRLDDGSVLWAVEIAGTLEIKSWVRGWGPDVIVIAPESLRAEVAADMRAAAAQYEL